MGSEIISNLSKLSNKYYNESQKLSEAYSIIRNAVLEIRCTEEKIKQFETLIARKRVDFDETIKFHSLKRDRECVNPVQNISIELNNIFTVNVIKQSLAEQIVELKKELEELEEKGGIIYNQYAGGIK